jgi:hypothetical protein
MVPLVIADVPWHRHSNLAQGIIGTRPGSAPPPALPWPVFDGIRQQSIRFRTGAIGRHP